jgi:hypothetical protein
MTMPHSRSNNPKDLMLRRPYQSKSKKTILSRFSEKALSAGWFSMEVLDTRAIFAYVAAKEPSLSPDPSRHHIPGRLSGRRDFHNVEKGREK